MITLGECSLMMLLIPQSERIKITENFFLDELIHPDYYDGTKRPLRFLDMRAVDGLQFLRDKLGDPITVNNWAVGGDFMFSGLRPMNSAIGARLSAHKFGRAFDPKCASGPALIHQIIRENEGELIQSQRITRVEKIEFTPTWAHIDNCFTGSDQIQFFKP